LTAAIVSTGIASDKDLKVEKDLSKKAACMKREAFMDVKLHICEIKSHANFLLGTHS
jgi:hypothetical protein